jgi:ribose 1,5-bisphosphate isomerase
MRSHEALIAPLRADVVSGAAVVARAASAAMRRGAVQLPADSPAALRKQLEALGLSVLDAQPSMASLVGLVARVVAAVRDDAAVEEGRRAAAQAAEAFREELDRDATRVAGSLSAALEEGARVLTISSSSTVREGLVGAREKGIHVIVLEGRPMNEGHALARTLSEAGVPVTLAVDAAAESLVQTADLVLLGADAVGDAGVVNKIGSVAAGRAAKAHGVPVWVAADRSKWLPGGFPLLVADDRPAEEIWRGARGARAWNRYFEVLPYDLVDRVLTEGGPVTPSELAEARSALAVPPVLTSWAAGRNS